jgi:putative cell wall-binding protein
MQARVQPEMVRAFVSILTVGGPLVMPESVLDEYRGAGISMKRAGGSVRFEIVEKEKDA